MRFHEPRSTRSPPSWPTIRATQPCNVQLWRRVQLQAQPRFGGALKHNVSGDFNRYLPSASTCSMRTSRFHFHPLLKTTTTMHAAGECTAAWRAWLSRAMAPASTYARYLSLHNTSSLFAPCSAFVKTVFLVLLDAHHDCC